MKTTILGMALLFLLLPAGIHGWDFMERPVAVIPGPAPAAWAVGAAGYYHTAYRNYAFRNTELDQFHVEIYGHQSLLDITPFRLGVFFSTIMVNGPVNEGDTPGAEQAQWMMNAAQFEYGFIGTWDLNTPTAHRTVLIGEYSRRSYHPFRSGFDDPAADILRGGIGMMGIRFPREPRLRLDGMVRVGWVELYEFWGAPSIPDPRALYTMNIALEQHYEIYRPAITLFNAVMVDVLRLRSGGFATDFTIETGLRLGRGAGRVELYVEAFHTDDTQQAKDRVAPATLFGYGLRMIMTTDRIP